VPNDLFLDDSTVCGDGNIGVAEQVQDITGAFGYVETGTLEEKNLDDAALQNGDGTNFVRPSAATAQAAAAGAAPNLPPAHGNWSEVEITLETGLNAYPAATFTYIVMFANPLQLQDDANTAESEPTMDEIWTAEQWATAKAYVEFVLTDGQDLVGQVALAPLDELTQSRALAGLTQLTPWGAGAEVTIEDTSSQGYPLVGHEANVLGTGEGFNAARNLAEITSDMFGVHNAEYSTSTGAEDSNGAVNGKWTQDEVKKVITNDGRGREWRNTLVFVQPSGDKAIESGTRYIDKARYIEGARQVLADESLDEEIRESIRSMKEQEVSELKEELQLLYGEVIDGDDLLNEFDLAAPMDLDV
jgi:hypothetical protein